MNRWEFVKRAKAQLKEIDLYFTTVQHWNDTIRKPTEERIEPDPDGDMEQARQYLKRFITAQEKADRS